MEDRQGLLEAINHLVMEPAAPRHFEILMEVAKLSPTLPVQLSKEAAILNPLLNLYRSDKPAYDRVMVLVDEKRTARGWEALVKEEPAGFDRNTYQREFMFQKRARERRAVEIENMLRPDRDKLVGNARLEFMRRASAGWKKRRDVLLEEARQHHGGTLSKEQTEAILTRFWATVDDELDQLQEETLRKLRGH